MIFKRFTPVIAPTQTNNIINAPQRKYTSQHKQNLPSKVKMSFGEALNSQPPRDFKVPPQIKVSWFKLVMYQTLIASSFLSQGIYL